MGLFDRLRAPSGRNQGSTVVSTLAPPPPLRAVPDVDDDGSALDDAVRAHLERLTAAAESDVDELSAEEFQAALTSRLVSAERVDSTGLGFSYAAPFADHVHEVLTLDLPTAVITLPDDRVLGTSRRTPRLFDRGRRNLRALMDTTEVDVLTLGDRRHGVTAVFGDSPYTASFARYLSDGVSRWTPTADQHAGIVFAVPHRHAVVFKTCGDARQTRDALDLVPLHADALHREDLSPVSPHVYHWYNRQISCLTTQNEDGSLTLRTTPVLASMLGARRAAG